MMNLLMERAGEGPLRVLCLGAHSDDIEIGCGGTLLELGRRRLGVEYTWVVFCAPGKRGEEARLGAERFAGGHPTNLHLRDFRDGFLPYTGCQVKEYFEELKITVDPDVVFTHWHGDAHQDHRLVSELTWNTFRNHLVLEYEIPKYDGDLGRPSVFVALEAENCRKKVEGLCDVFESQRCKPWFTRETFLGLMRLRGMECNARSGYAEAFHARKLLVDPTA